MSHQENHDDLVYFSLLVFFLFLLLFLILVLNVFHCKQTSVYEKLHHNKINYIFGAWFASGGSATGLAT